MQTWLPVSRTFRTVITITLTGLVRDEKFLESSNLRHKNSKTSDYTFNTRLTVELEVEP